MGGTTYSTKFEVKLGLSLPEFNPNSICSTSLRYHRDIIGQDLCIHMGLVVDYDNAIIKWNDVSIPMKE
jgi:hypothetical protein